MDRFLCIYFFMKNAEEFEKRGGLNFWNQLLAVNFFSSDQQPWQEGLRSLTLSTVLNKKKYSLVLRHNNENQLLFGKKLVMIIKSANTYTHYTEYGNW